MTWSDPIVEEVRRARGAYAARFNYDLRAIYQDLKEKEKRSGRKVVSHVGTSTGAETKNVARQTEQAPTTSDKIPLR